MQYPKIIEDIRYLVQQGGASGICFIISTQYPRGDVVDKLISMNCDIRIALHMKEDNASRVVLDNDLATKIKAIPGRAVYQYGEDYILQVPLLDDETESGQLQRQLLKDRYEELAHKKTQTPIYDFRGEII